MHTTSTTTTTATTESDTRSAAAALRNRLRLNGAFSMLTGIVAATAAGPLTDLFGLDQTWIIRVMGLALVGFSATLFLIARQQPSTLRILAGPIVVADLGWVAGTAAVIALGWLSTAGAVTMALLAVVVLELAIAQWQARRRLIAQQPHSSHEAAKTVDA